PVYGARPWKRVIQRELQNPLAQQILEGRIPDGATVRVTASPLGLVIGEAERAGAAEPRRRLRTQRARGAPPAPILHPTPANSRKPWARLAAARCPRIYVLA